MIGNIDPTKGPRMRKLTVGCYQNILVRLLDMELRLRNFTAVDKGRALHVTMLVGWRLCFGCARFLHQGAISFSIASIL